MTQPRTRIAFFGSSLFSSYWNGAATYYRGIIRALHARGYDVTFFEPVAYGRQERRDFTEAPEWAAIHVYTGDEEGVAKALQAARTADWVVKASGVGIFDELLEREVLQVGRHGAGTIFWDVDAPATLDRVRENADDPFRSLIPKYDMILTYGGGQPVVSAYLALGARACVPIYNALDPSTHYPDIPDPALRSDLSFLGNRLPDREERVDEYFLKPAARLPEQTFLLAGSGWGGKPMTPNVRYIVHLYTAQHNVFNCSARAVLNVTRNSMAKYGFSPATRVFEAAGAGACIISDYWDGIEMFFEPGREILVARSGDQVTGFLKDLSPAEAAEIGAAALKRVLSEHTYSQRAEQVHSILAGRHVAAAR